MQRPFVMVAVFYPVINDRQVQFGAHEINIPLDRLPRYVNLLSELPAVGEAAALDFAMNLEDAFKRTTRVS